MTGAHLDRQVERWGCFELALSGSAEGNPFLEVELTAQFTQAGRSVQVDGFYDGEGVYRIRFMPEAEGQWEYMTRSNSAALDGQTGSFTCVAPGADNHGPVRVANTFHFAYADGTAYVPVGTTCYVWNLQGDELEEQTLATLRDAPFNKMRMCVFPKNYAFNRNEPPRYPFPGQPTRERPPLAFDLKAEPPSDYWDFSRFNPEYFRHLERRILDLQGLGIEADLILFHPYDFGAWGFDRMPAEVNQRYLRYIVARLAAFRNLWWSFANEYELLLDRTMDDWDGYFQLVQERDPYNHLRSVHNIISFYDHTKPWVTHCSVQHGDLARMTSWLSQYGKPVVIDECGYEGDISHLWGNLSPQEMVMRFWLGFADGGYVGHGETYLNATETLWWSKGGALVGESVPRIAFLRTIFEAAPAGGLLPLSPKRFVSLASFDEMLALFTSPERAHSIFGEGGFNAVAGSHSGTDYYLLYFATRQPAYCELNLPDGRYDIDIIDTWEMTVERAAETVAGQARVTLPGKPYQALRIARNA
jgi:hypothetical protein